MSPYNLEDFVLNKASARVTLGTHWVRGGPVCYIFQTYFISRQAKIALRASSEDQLVELEAIAKSLNLCARSIHDASVIMSSFLAVTDYALQRTHSSGGRNTDCCGHWSCSRPVSQPSDGETSSPMILISTKIRLRI